MDFAIGELVQNDATGEEGRIVRFFEHSEHKGYIAAEINKLSTQSTVALWFRRERG
jgi:hypothetical protein